MITDPKAINKQQTVLREALKGDLPHEEAIQLCLNQHAMLHSGKATQGKVWSFEDEILDDLPEATFRCIPSTPDEAWARRWSTS